MIQLTNNRAASAATIKNTNGAIVGDCPQNIIENKEKRLEQNTNAYVQSEHIHSPTYNEEIQQLMNKENIPVTGENIKITTVLNDYGIQIDKDQVKQIKEMKDALNKAVNQLQGEHITKLQEQGYDIEQLTIDMIAKIIGNIPLATVQKENDIPAIADDEVVRSLIEACLPLTNKNIETLTKYKEKIQDISSADDTMIQNIVRTNVQITINHLYAAKHSGVTKNNFYSISEEQIIRVLEGNAVEITKENIAATQNLIQGNIEVTKENIVRTRRVKDIVQNLDIKQLLKDATIHMKQGKNPSDVILEAPTSDLSASQLHDDMEELVENIKQVDEEIIIHTYHQNQSVTLGNLQKALLQKIKQDIECDYEQQSEKQQQEVPFESVIKVRRQIEEIRLRLTVEAAIKLHNKFDIQTADLQKVVQELKVIEQEQYEQILHTIDAPVNEHNVEAMEKTMDHLRMIHQNREISAVQVIENKVPFTLEGMDQGIAAQKASQRYEEMETKPERRFGESIRKVEDQIGHILELEGIEKTDVNIKAAKALIENEVEITGKSIQHIKTVLMKIDTAIEGLRPVVIAQMLKEGIRPDIIHVDKIIEYVQEKQLQKNEGVVKTIAEAILELDQSKQLQPNEREGLIAVYRMLHIIGKNEEKAIGFLVKNEKELTLGNLFEASKYVKQMHGQDSKMDITINDQFGLQEGELPSNIRDIIHKATNHIVDIQEVIQETRIIEQDPALVNSNSTMQKVVESLLRLELPITSENVEKWSYDQQILRKWINEITPENLKRYVAQDQPLEEILTDRKTMPSVEEKQIIKQIRELETISPQSLNFIKEYSIQPTIQNIYWVDKMIKNPFLLGDTLKEYKKLINEEFELPLTMKEEQNVKEILDGLQKELQKQTAVQLSVPQSTQAYAMGKELEQILQVSKQISTDEVLYQIPIQLHQGVSNLNLYVMKDKQHKEQVEQKELRAYMSMKTQNLGVIQVFMRISDKAVAFEMSGETPQITSRLKKNSSELAKSIEQIGYHVIHAHFKQKEAANPFVQKPVMPKTLQKHKFEDSVFEHIV